MKDFLHKIRGICIIIAFGFGASYALAQDLPSATNAKPAPKKPAIGNKPITEKDFLALLKDLCQNSGGVDDDLHDDADDENTDENLQGKNTFEDSSQARVINFIKTYEKHNLSFLNDLESSASLAREKAFVKRYRQYLRSILLAVIGVYSQDGDDMDAWWMGSGWRVLENISADQERFVRSVATNSSKDYARFFDFVATLPVSDFCDSSTCGHSTEFYIVANTSKELQTPKNKARITSIANHGFDGYVSYMMMTPGGHEEAVEDFFSSLRRSGASEQQLEKIVQFFDYAGEYDESDDSDELEYSKTLLGKLASYWAQEYLTQLYNAKMILHIEVKPNDASEILANTDYYICGDSTSLNSATKKLCEKEIVKYINSDDLEDDYLLPDISSHEGDMDDKRDIKEAQKFFIADRQNCIITSYESKNGMLIPTAKPSYTNKSPLCKALQESINKQIKSTPPIRISTKK